MENESCRNIDTHYPALISMTKKSARVCSPDVGLGDLHCAEIAHFQMCWKDHSNQRSQIEFGEWKCKFSNIYTHIHTMTRFYIKRKKSAGVCSADVGLGGSALCRNCPIPAVHVEPRKRSQQLENVKFVWFKWTGHICNFCIFCRNAQLHFPWTLVYIKLPII